eukprot:747202-Hanusia_phi.AAC.1
MLAERGRGGAAGWGSSSTLLPCFSPSPNSPLPSMLSPSRKAPHGSISACRPLARPTTASMSASSRSGMEGQGRRSFLLNAFVLSVLIFSNGSPEPAGAEEGSAIISGEVRLEEGSDKVFEKYGGQGQLVLYSRCVGKGMISKKSIPVKLQDFPVSEWPVKAAGKPKKGDETKGVRDGGDEGGDDDFDDHDHNCGGCGCDGDGVDDGVDDVSTLTIWRIGRFPFRSQAARSVCRDREGLYRIPCHVRLLYDILSLLPLSSVLCPIPRLFARFSSPSSSSSLPSTLTLPHLVPASSGLPPCSQGCYSSSRLFLHPSSLSPPVPSPCLLSASSRWSEDDIFIRAELQVEDKGQQKTIL